MTKPFLYSDVLKALDDDRLYSAHGIILASKENGTLRQFAAHLEEHEEEAARLLKINLQSRLSKSPMKEQKVKFEAERGRIKSGLTGRPWKIHILGEDAVKPTSTCPVDDQWQELRTHAQKTEQGITEVLTQEKQIASEMQTIRQRLSTSSCYVPQGMTAVVTRDPEIVQMLQTDQKENERAVTPKTPLLKPRFSKKLILAFCVALVACAATLVEKSSFQIRKEKGSQNALEFLVGLGKLTEKQQMERAALEKETGNIEEALKIAHDLKTSSIPTVSASALDLLSTIAAERGDQEAAQQYLDEAIAVYRSEDQYRTRLIVALVHLARLQHSPQPLDEAAELLDAEDEEYWYLNAQIARERINFAATLEEEHHLTQVAIAAAKKDHHAIMLGYLYKNLALLELELNMPLSDHYLTAQKYASETKNHRLWLSTLLPKGMTAKRTENTLEYQWVLQTLETHLQTNSNPHLQRSLEYLKSWEPVHARPDQE